MTKWLAGLSTRMDIGALPAAVLSLDRSGWKMALTFPTNAASVAIRTLKRLPNIIADQRMMMVFAIAAARRGSIAGITSTVG
jgi:hypothetical protein